ncbi:MAG TPA: PPE domain-containing protein [Mycobacterium sp.]|nr:PPE domain-containing protein [Mycobacterium sp.]
MDFAMLPPEVNSARMYSGAGSGPMLAAAASWDALAVELHSVGMAYETVITELNNGWSGPSAAAMAAAAAPYATWMHTTSAQAEQTATHAKAAAAGYESAFAMTVPPPVVAANRTRLMSLLATNLLGQNTLAIAATEAQYAEMWAQDAAAMYGYAHSAAAAAQLTAFTEPPQTTNPAGPAGQDGAVGQATANSVAAHTDTVTSAVTHALQGLASPAAATSASNAPAALNALAPALASDPGIAAAFAALASSLFGTFVIDSAGSFGIDVAGSFGIDLIGVGEIGAELLPLEEEIAESGGLVAASLGEAGTLSGLSVPPAWTVAAPSVIQQLGAPLSAAAAAPAIAAGETGLPFAEMATAGLAGRASAAAGRGRRGGTGTTTRQHPAQPQQPAPQPEQPEQPEQPQRPANGPITRIAGELRELAELRDAGILTEEEFTEQKRRLLGR